MTDALEAVLIDEIAFKEREIVRLTKRREKLRRQLEEKPLSEPKLLRIPRSFRSVDEVIAVAGKLNLPNILVLAEHESGNLTILDSDLTLAQTNWLLDRAKQALLGPAPVHPDDVQ